MARGPRRGRKRQGEAVCSRRIAISTDRQAGPSRNDIAESRDIWLRARIVLNHPDLYPRGRVRLARQTLQAERPGRWLRLRWVLVFLKDLRARRAARQLAGVLGLHA